MKEAFRVLRYALVASSAGLLESASFALLTTATAWSYWPCYLIALVLSVLWNFTLNRKVTFHSAGNVPVAMLKVAAYYAIFTPVSTILGNHLVAIGWNEYLVTLLNMLVNGVTEFLYQRLFVFGKSIDSAKEKEPGTLQGVRSIH